MTRENESDGASADKVQHKDFLAFLPAALEVVETPANPLGRAIVLTIAGLTVLGLLWAFVGRVDMHATASGRLIPTDRVKLVQTREGGRVEHIRVREGMRVQAGQPILILDQAEAQADLTRIVEEMKEISLILIRLETELNFLEAHHPARTEILPTETEIQAVDWSRADFDDADEAALLLARHVMQADLSAFYAGIKALDAEMAQTEAQSRATLGESLKWREMAPLLEERVQAYDYLESEKLTPRQISMELRQDLVAARHNIVIQQAEAERIAAQLQALQNRRVEIIAQFQQERLNQLIEARRHYAGLRQERVKAETRLAHMTITAPLTGTVQQLSVTTEGGVVQPAQQIAIIVPEEGGLLLEADILNKDIGFVAPGQEVAIKLETFPFTKYGLVRGEILQIDRAAVISAMPPPQPDPNDPNASRSNMPPPGLTYRARIALERDFMMVDGRTVPLSPGMNATAEVKIGQRRIIEFLLSPLLRATRESLRER